jgi:thioredoxin 1
MVAFITELNEENYKKFTESGLVLVDVWAPWCGPCKLISPIIDQISADFQGRLSVGKLEADNSREIVSELGVRSIPTLILYKDGQEIERKVGSINKGQLEDLINQYLN